MFRIWTENQDESFWGQRKWATAGAWSEGWSHLRVARSMQLEVQSFASGADNST